MGLGPIRIDTDRAYVERAGKELTLSALEYRLLLLFATNPGKLVTRDKIRDALWAVSYTHLDVYKRQREHQGDIVGGGELAKRRHGEGGRTHKDDAHGYSVSPGFAPRASAS